MKFILVFFFFIITILSGYAQDTTKTWLHTGVSMISYKGDLSGYDKYTSAFHVGIKLNRKHRINGNFNIGFGSINGEDRNFTFESTQTPLPNPSRFIKTNFFYLNYDLHANLIKRRNIIVYLSQGIGLLRFSPENDAGEQLIDQPTTREEGEIYRKEAFMLPTNIGVIYLLPNQYGISFQAGFFNTMTDYLDNVSNLGDSKNDNILAFRFAFFVPLDF